MYLMPFENILSFNFFGFNLIDLIMVIVLVFYAIEGYSEGFVVAFLDFISFIASFILGLKFYYLIASLLVKFLSIPQGFADAAGFFLIFFIGEIIINLILRFFSSKIPKKIFMSKANSYLGFIPGILSAVVLLSFIFTLIISLPFSPFLKNLIVSSKFGDFLVLRTAGFESNLNNIFGKAINETLNFLTIEPQSNDFVNLNFKVSRVDFSPIDEEKMLQMINKERTSRNLPPLASDQALTKVAREHSKDMFIKGYFSHYTPSGLSPFDRLAEDNIGFTYAGENLAMAPSVELAMQGLMNSQGHRENILSPNFTKAGIGVADGGIFGKMFSQEFTD